MHDFSGDLAPRTPNGAKPLDPLWGMAPSDSLRLASCTPQDENLATALYLLCLSPVHEKFKFFNRSQSAIDSAIRNYPNIKSRIFFMHNSSCNQENTLKGVLPKKKVRYDSEGVLPNNKAHTLQEVF